MELDGRDLQDQVGDPCRARRHLSRTNIRLPTWAERDLWWMLRTTPWGRKEEERAESEASGTRSRFGTLLWPRRVDPPGDPRKMTAILGSHLAARASVLGHAILPLDGLHLQLKLPIWALDGRRRKSSRLCERTQDQKGGRGTWQDRRERQRQKELSIHWERRNTQGNQELLEGAPEPSLGLGRRWNAQTLGNLEIERDRFLLEFETR